MALVWQFPYGEFENMCKTLAYDYANNKDRYLTVCIELATRWGWNVPNFAGMHLLLPGIRKIYDDINDTTKKEA